jgi:Heavy metal binding domain
MTRIAVAAIAAATLASSVEPQRPAGPSVRFHHLHYRVLDPGASLRQTTGDLQGSRAIVQGVGVGVRVGREYVLFERESEDRRGRPRSPSAAFAEAAAWLTSRGLTVYPQELGQTLVTRALPAQAFDHLGFATDDLDAAVAAIGQKPLSLTDVVATFKLRSGLVVEIVRDTDRPDAYWCPMHPDIRSAASGKCPICRMALVPIPPPRIGEYKLDVTVAPSAGGGASGFRFVVRDPESGEAVPGLLDVHERPFHLFILSRDLETFAHVHPERHDGGAFVVTHELPAGEYVLLADFLPAGGTSQLVHRAVVTPGYTGPLFASAPEIRLLPAQQTAGGLRIRIDPGQPAARRESLVRFEVSDAATGGPVADLEPYLGASGHLLIVNQDLSIAIHSHPEGAPSSGPLVIFGAVFPAPGRYKLWVQFQRNGQVVTAPFVIEIPKDLR